MQLRECRWGPICQRAMRTLMIVMLAELCQLLPSIIERGEPLHVQTLVAKSAVETLDKPVFHWPSRPNETQLYLVGHRPSFQSTAAELTPIIHRDAFRQAAAFLLRAFQRLGHFHPRHSTVCFQPNTLSRELVDHRQNGTSARPRTCRSQNPCSNTGSVAPPWLALWPAVGAPSSAAAWSARSTLPPGTDGRSASRSHASLPVAAAPLAADTRSAHAFPPTPASDAARLHRTPSGSDTAASLRTR
jgi:hypothetical protein